MSYNFTGLSLIFTNFFHNIIIKPQEYYITPEEASDQVHCAADTLVALCIMKL